MATETTTVSVVSYSSNWKKLKESLPVKEKAEVHGGWRRFNGEAGGEGPQAKRRRMNREKKANVEAVVESTSSEKASQSRLTKALAMDCEFVGVGPNGMDNMVARISLVNAHGECVYDKYVKPTEDVTDYRTAISGIREENLVSGEEFDVVQKEVCEMIEGHRMVGHAINHDFKVLHLSHPKRDIRDTSKYKPFRAIAHTKHPALKKLCQLVLGIRIQDGEHDSICDAKAAMQLYQLHKRDWEAKIRNPRAATKTRLPEDVKLGFGVQNGVAVDTRRSARYKYQKRDHRKKEKSQGRKRKAKTSSKNRDKRHSKS